MNLTFLASDCFEKEVSKSDNTHTVYTSATVKIKLNSTLKIKIKIDGKTRNKN